MSGRKCIFCGGRADSIEDAWPLWISKLTGDKVGQITFHSPRGKRVWPGKYVRARRTCRNRCNNGWMSRLEEDAKPIMTPMIEGTPTDLDVTQQLTMAFWSMKTAMVYDAIESQGRTYFSKDQRIQLLSSMEGRVQLPLPRNARVWLASYRGIDMMNSTGIVLDGVGQSSDSLEKTQVPGFAFTMAAGHFVMQLLVARIASKHAAVPTYIHAATNRFDRSTCEIWPIHGPHVSWPPQNVLDDSAMSLDDFCNRWNPSDAG